MLPLVSKSFYSKDYQLSTYVACTTILKWDMLGEICFKCSLAWSVRRLLEVVVEIRAVEMKHLCTSLIPCWKGGGGLPFRCLRLMQRAAIPIKNMFSVAVRKFLKQQHGVVVEAM